ncbi:MAG: hypothetical protein OEZ10_00500 [Gammaproteobacteria bacterium]|nr:hypothetical protein [Gammaproteobacteria bacterium]
MHVRRFNIPNSLKWFSCGQRLIRKNTPAWVITASIVFAAAWLLLQIPILGQLILVFLLPIIAASSLGEMHLAMSVSDESLRASRRNQNIITLLQRDIGYRLAGIFKQGDRFIFALAFGALALCAALGINILEQLFGGAARLESVSVFDAGFAGAVRYIAIQLITISAYAAVVGLMLFTLPLVTLQHMSIHNALSLNLAAWIKNFVPLITYFGIMVGVITIGRVVMGIDYFAGLLAMFFITVLGGPLAIASAYCCFRLMYREE